MSLLPSLFVGAAGGAWFALVYSLAGAVARRRQGARWIGDLRPGTRVAGPGHNEVWTVTGTTLSAARGGPPTLTVDLVAGAAPRQEAQR